MQEAFYLCLDYKKYLDDKMIGNKPAPDSGFLQNLQVQKYLLTGKLIMTFFPPCDVIACSWNTCLTTEMKMPNLTEIFNSEYVPNLFQTEPLSRQLMFH